MQSISRLSVEQLLAISCAGSDNRANQEEQYALLENQRIEEERLKGESIRNSLRVPIQPDTSSQLEVNPRQFIHSSSSTGDPDRCYSALRCSVIGRRD